jgi:hypothetical protein
MGQRERQLGERVLGITALVEQLGQQGSHRRIARGLLQVPAQQQQRVQTPPRRDQLAGPPRHPAAFGFVRGDGTGRRVARNIGAERPEPGELIHDRTDCVAFEIGPIESFERRLVGFGCTGVAEAAHRGKVRGER